MPPETSPQDEISAKVESLVRRIEEVAGTLQKIVETQAAQGSKVDRMYALLFEAKDFKKVEEKG
jgi:hypothetical protein